MNIITKANIVDKTARKIRIRLQRKWFQLLFIKPDYWIRNSLQKNSIVVDCGIGNNADFSQNLIQRYGVKCFGFEPTQKHHASLNEIVQRHKGLFEYYPFAISDDNRVQKFFESNRNISGSLLKDHNNIINDSVISYNVETITVDKIFDYLGIDNISLLKLDIEGEEYPVLRSISKNSLERIEQISVEFHQFCVARYTKDDTSKVVMRLKESGFRTFTNDGKTFLFFRV